MRPGVRRRGAISLELALTAPVLLLLGIGTVEWGWYLHQELALVQAVRNGALAGAVARVSAGPASLAEAGARRAMEAAGLPTGDATITATLTPLSDGTAIHLDVRLPYAPISALLPLPATLRATATMRLVDS